MTFVIDEYAMSAGTMIALSGNSIMMHYAATLGPIDPQVLNHQGKYVPATGYLHQYQKLLEKAESGFELSEADIMILQSFDAATLSLYESAIQLATDLVTEWLEKYKFKYWNTKQDKGQRAKQIAAQLSDFKRWHSHSRPLGLTHLNQLQIQIVDYSNKQEFSLLHQNITEYRNLAQQIPKYADSHCFSFSKDLIQSNT